MTSRRSEQRLPKRRGVSKEARRSRSRNRSSLRTTRSRSYARSQNRDPRSAIAKTESISVRVQPNSSSLSASSGRLYEDLPLEWWERSDGCREAKLRHTDRIDRLCSSREFLVLQTTLLHKEIALEPNMFPYATPPSVAHYTLWSRSSLSHQQIEKYVDAWLARHMPQVRRWNYDDNLGDQSILLFHVHVYIELTPFAFQARPDLLYRPPHCASERLSDL
eukprot:gene35412-42922_t